MSQPQTPSNGAAPADLIKDYETLRAQQQTIHRWSVVNLAPENGDGPTVYEVDTLNRACSCANEKYNADDNHACKHLAYVLSGAGQSIEISDAMAYDLGNAVRDARETLKDFTHSTTAPTTDKGRPTPDADAEGGETDESGDDAPDASEDLEAVKKAASRAGVPVGDGVDVYLHTEYGTVNIEKDGNMVDSEFSSLIDFVQQEGISSTGGDYHWYVDDVEEVV